MSRICPLLPARWRGLVAKHPAALRWLLSRRRSSSGSLLLAHAACWSACAGWYTSRPQFCNSCHIMEPYYKSWQESSHKDVSCIECHFPPGFGGKVRGKMLGLVQLAKYVTASAGAAALPPRSPMPVACGRGCHETRLLTGRVDFHGVPFDHTPHLERDAARQATALHQLPQPDRAGAAHDGDHLHLLPLPFQGPALQRGPGRLHPLPPDPRREIRPRRRRDLHPRPGLRQGRGLRQLPRRRDPRQGRGAAANAASPATIARAT